MTVSEDDRRRTEATDRTPGRQEDRAPRPGGSEEGEGTRP